MEKSNPARTKELAAMGRKKLRMGIDLLTEHLALRTHLFNIGLVEQKNCRLCEEESKDSVHLCRCPMLACKRYRSHMFLTLEDLDGAKIGDLAIGLTRRAGLGFSLASYFEKK